MAKYVCCGAKLKCSMGSRESELGVMPVRRTLARINGKLMGTIMDHKPMVNIKPFGQCQSLANPIVAAATAANYGKLQKMPCIPNTATPWIGGKMRVRICGEPTLLDSSKLTCMWAGMIEITDPGQDFVKDGGSPLNAKNGSVQSEEKAKDVAVVAGTPVESEEKEKVKELTVKDFVEILEEIESKQGYEAARHYASNRIDYWKINNLAKKYVNEANEEKKKEEMDNDPNLMPTRFMILYGADDKLKKIDRHPDNFEDQPEHDMCVEKLREALILLGNDIEKTGSFDDTVYFAFLKYLRQYSRVDLNRYYAEDEIADERLDRFADEHGVFSWRYFEKHDRDHDSIKKELSPEYGNELLAEKGANPGDYLPGICYHYPWNPFRLAVKLGDEYKDKEVKYKIYGRKSRRLLAEGEIGDPFKVEMLLPDAGKLLIIVDGMEMELSPDYSHLRK